MYFFQLIAALNKDPSFHNEAQYFSLSKNLGTSFLTMRRPQFIKSFVIVIYFFGTEMCDVILIIDYCCIVTLQQKTVAK